MFVVSIRDVANVSKLYSTEQVCRVLYSRHQQAASAYARANVPTTRHVARRRTLSKTAVTVVTSVLASRETCAITATGVMKTEDCTATSCSTTVIAASAGRGPHTHPLSLSLSLSLSSLNGFYFSVMPCSCTSHSYLHHRTLSLRPHINAAINYTSPFSPLITPRYVVMA